LDNSSTVEEVIKSDSLVRITSKGTPLHYLVADAKGRVATIEFLEGKLKAHKGEALPYPVLTNNTYEQSVSSHTHATTKGNNSLERFSMACNKISQLNSNNRETSLVEKSFDILNAVNQGDYTKWSIVYDITEKKIWFKTQRFNQVRSINFSALDFSCGVRSKFIYMNGKESGNISPQMTQYTDQINQRILETAAGQSSSRVAISGQEISRILAYPATIICK